MIQCQKSQYRELMPTCTSATMDVTVTNIEIIHGGNNEESQRMKVTVNRVRLTCPTSQETLMLSGRVRMAMLRKSCWKHASRILPSLPVVRVLFRRWADKREIQHNMKLLRSVEASQGQLIFSMSSPASMCR